MAAEDNRRNDKGDSAAVKFAGQVIRSNVCSEEMNQVRCLNGGPGIEESCLHPLPRQMVGGPENLHTRPAMEE
jgi:hypothetical protein